MKAVPVSSAGPAAMPAPWWSQSGQEDVLLMGELTAAAPGQAPGVPQAAIAALAALPNDLQRLLRGHSVVSLRRPASDGGWGIVEHLCHLRDWNAVFGERVATIASTDNPVLETYDDELWVIEHHYRDQDPLKVLAAFQRERRALIDQLRALQGDAWLRTGQLGRLQLTISQQVERMGDHDRKHYQLIADALA